MVGQLTLVHNYLRRRKWKDSFSHDKECALHYCLSVIEETKETNTASGNIICSCRKLTMPGELSNYAGTLFFELIVSVLEYDICFFCTFVVE